MEGILTTKIGFNTKVYVALYQAILILIAKVDAHEYHGALLQQMLKDIAQARRLIIQRLNINNLISPSFPVLEGLHHWHSDLMFEFESEARLQCYHNYGF